MVSKVDKIAAMVLIGTIAISSLTGVGYANVLDDNNIGITIIDDNTDKGDSSNNLGIIDGTENVIEVDIGDTDNKHDSVVNKTEVDRNKHIVMQFKDIEWHWAKDVINKWKDLGIIEGISDTEFGAELSMSRADFSVIIGRVIGLEDGDIEGNTNISDLSRNKYYTKSVDYMINCGGLLVTDNKVRPLDSITREEAAHLLYRALGIVDTDIDKERVNKFKDKGNIDKVYYESIEHLAGLGMLNGDTSGNILPKKHLTRAECVKLIDNILSNLVKDSSNYNKNETNIFTFSEKGVSIVESYMGTVSRFLVEKLNIEKSELAEAVVVSKSRGNDKDGRGEGLVGDVVGSEVGRLVVGDSMGLRLSGGSRIGEVVVTDGNVLEIISSDSSVHNIRLGIGSILRVDGKEYRNNTEHTMDIMGIPCGDDIISSKEYKLSLKRDKDNRLHANIKLGSLQASELREIGIVGSDGYVLPTIKSFNIKAMQRKNGTFDLIQKAGSTRCYRLYVRDLDGLITYSEPVFVTSYDYNIGLKDSKSVWDSKANKLKKEVYLTISGSNVPSISVDNTYILSGATRNTGNDMLSRYPVKLVDGVGRGLEQSTYKADIEYRVADGNEIEMDGYYGYSVCIQSDIGLETKEIYPLLVDKDIESINNTKISIESTNIVGDGVEVKGSVENRDIDNSKSKYGIVYKAMGIGDSNGGVPDIDSTWSNVAARCKDGNTIDGKVSGVDLSKNRVYMALYTLHNKNKIYSDIVEVAGNTVPIYTGSKVVSVNHDCTAALLKLGVLSSSNINIRASTVEIRTGNSIRKETLDKLSGNYNNNILSVVADKLECGSMAELKFELVNDIGVSDNIVVILDMG